MLTHLFWMGIGLVLLVAGADALVRGASRLALSFGVSPLVVGLTVVAFGTSAPEFAVSVGAAHSGNVEIAIGNVVGSNIFNVLFILGAAAVIAPLVVDAQLIRQEVPVMVAATALLFLLASDQGVSRVDGFVLFGVLLAYTTFLVVQSSATRAEYAEAVETASHGGPGGRRAIDLGYLLGVVGLSALVAPGDLPVPASVLAFDLPVMTAVAVACLPVFFTGRTIARWEGLVFLGYYVAYTAYLILATQRHEATEAFGDAMLGFVLPITVLTLAVSLAGELEARRG